jgi:hypothetical protein
LASLRIGGLAMIAEADAAGTELGREAASGADAAIPEAVRVEPSPAPAAAGRVRREATWPLMP